MSRHAYTLATFTAQLSDDVHAEHKPAGWSRTPPAQLQRCPESTRGGCHPPRPTTKPAARSGTRRSHRSALTVLPHRCSSPNPPVSLPSPASPPAWRRYSAYSSGGSRKRRRPARRVDRRSARRLTRHPPPPSPTCTPLLAPHAQAETHGGCLLREPYTSALAARARRLP